MRLSCLFYEQLTLSDIWEGPALVAELCGVLALTVQFPLSLPGFESLLVFEKKLPETAD